MCGIYGMVSFSGAALRAPHILSAMSRSLRHRGPDSQGLRAAPHFALGCERLRVMDLRPCADQPFCDPEERAWLACNGEIYNAAELRRRYPDYPFASRSDVEAILPLFLSKGEGGLRELDGMFGLAIWDDKRHTLTLARDRAGEKPLFYCRVGDELWFASEVQALLQHPSVSRDLDEEAIAQYLTLGYVPEPRTLFRQIRKVEAGTLNTFTRHGCRTLHYWDPYAMAPSPAMDHPTLPRLRSLLVAAVRKQMTADVPVGVFLSGGMDSALIASIAAHSAPRHQLSTFTAKFTESSYDESCAAARCTQRLGTHHHEVLIDDGSLKRALDAVTQGLAEPLADPAILPTYLLAEEARKHVTVVLSGEGADELFGGYPTYLGHNLVPYLQALPATGRAVLRAGAGLLPTSHGKVTLEFLLKRFLADAEKPWLERHLSWAGTGAQCAQVRNGHPRPPFPELPVAARAPSGISGAMLLDYQTYLTDGLLTKSDRATMFHSLEARAPFLDRDLSAFALNLPERAKVRRLTTKWLLKKAAREWLPKDAVKRRKRGLSVPIASWLNGGLRRDVDRLLAPKRLARQEILDAKVVQRLLGEHRAGRANHARPLWTLMILQYWLDRWAPARAA